MSFKQTSFKYCSLITTLEKKDWFEINKIQNNKYQMTERN